MMHLFRPQNMMADIIFADPSAINVINRFGIFLGVGDITIEEMCKEKGIETDFFLAIVNTFLNAEYFPESVLRSGGLPAITGYLEKTNFDLREYELPNIERHFHSLIKRSNRENSNLPILLRFFMEMKEELLSHISFDSENLFPALARERVTTAAFDEIKSYLRDEDDAIEDKLNDLLRFFVIHLNGEYDWNLCRAVVNAVFTLAKDIRQNNRIRKRILLPLIENFYPREDGSE